MKCLLCGKKTDFILTKILRGGQKGKVFYCETCELGMLDKTSSKKALIDFYKHKYRKHPLYKQSDTPEGLFNLYSGFQQARVKLLEQYLNRRTELLEVGCSAGMFLYNVRKFTDRIVGIDYDTKSGEFASNKCRCLVFDKDIEKTGISKKSFDIICMYQVLEHSQDPIKFILQYKKYLKPDGLMVIEVPNIKDSLRYVYDIPSYDKFYFHPAHLWYFSEKSLTILMKKAGLSGNIIFTQSYNILNHLHWIDTNVPQPSCIPGLAIPSFSFKDCIDYKITEELASFIESVDSFYKKTLSDLKITDNITFIGAKNG